MVIQFHRHKINKIKIQLEKLELLEQISYLSDELESFRLENSGDEANEVINWFEGKLAAVERQIIFSKVKNKGKNTTEKSFRWENSEIKLKNLFEGMKMHLIAENTQWEDFKAVFSQTPFSQIKKIEWTQSSSLLAYFVFMLAGINGLISTSDNQWVIAERCFTKAKNLRKLNENRLSREMNVRGLKLVDNLFSS